MSWKDNPKIRDLEPYATVHNYDMVVVLGIKPDGETYEIVTYGKTKSLCKQADGIGARLNRAVQAGMVIV